MFKTVQVLKGKNEAIVKTIGKEYFKCTRCSYGYHCDLISMLDVKGDEFTVLLLSIVYDLNVCVILNGEIWFAKKNSRINDCALYLGYIGSNGYVHYLPKGHSSKKYSQLISKLNVYKARRNKLFIYKHRIVLAVWYRKRFIQCVKAVPRPSQEELDFIFGHRTIVDEHLTPDKLELSKKKANMNGNIDNLVTLFQCLHLKDTTEPSNAFLSKTLSLSSNFELDFETDTVLSLYKTPQNSDDISINTARHSITFRSGSLCSCR